MTGACKDQCSSARCPSARTPGLTPCLPHLACHALQGTLTHMAPEHLMLGRCSKASDVYAFGILLWEVATGGKAFAGVLTAAHTCPCGARHHHYTLCQQAPCAFSDSSTQVHAAHHQAIPAGL
jgi:serine/threonine protein kinase